MTFFIFDGHRTFNIHIEEDEEDKEKKELQQEEVSSIIIPFIVNNVLNRIFLK